MFWLGGPGTIFVLMAFAFAMYAQRKVMSTYQRYSRISNRRGLTGSETAQALLKQHGVYDVTVEQVAGNLTDHYDPRVKKLRLSPDIYHGTSLAALGIAAHETGHALQHNVGYAPLAIRNAIVPIAQLGSTLALPLFMAGFILSWPSLADIGILFFLAAVVFQIATLPVEFDASSRAIAMLGDGNYLSQQEIGPARAVLQAAALTYVAAAATAIAQLLRLLMLRRSRD